MASLLVRAAWVCPVADPAAGRRLGARPGRGHRRLRAGPRRAGGRSRSSTSGRGACCRDSSTPTPTSSCRGCAAGCRRRRTSCRWVGQLLRLRTRLETVDDGRAIDAAARRRRRSCGPPGPWRSATSATRWCRRRCSATCGCRRSCSTSCSGSASPTARRPLAEARARRAAWRAPGSASSSPRTRRSRSRRSSSGRFVTRCGVGRPASRRCTSASRRRRSSCCATARGPWRTRLEQLGAWRDDWTPPGCGPGDYLCDLGVLRRGTLVVHGVQLTDARAGAHGRGRAPRS